MKFEDLSPEDQKLLNTDLGDFEKEASARLELCNEMYEVGYNKLAAETADNLDAYFAKVAEEGGASNEVVVDGQTEKVAQELGSFIEKGFTDGLAKLGQDRHGDPLTYFYPYMEEKVAAKGAKAFLANFGKKIKGFGGKVKSVGKDVAKKTEKGVEAVKKYHKGAVKEVKKGVKAKDAKGVAKGTGKLVGPYAALLGAGGAGAYAAKKD